MAMTQLNPYLNFNGTAEEAIALYGRALGAKVERLMRFGDVQGMPTPEEHKQRVMHAELRIGGSPLFLSDTPPGETVAPGTNTYVCVNFDNPDDTAAPFEALAAGGTILMPLADQFWGARFGMLIDRFGIRWMLNGQKPQA